MKTTFLLLNFLTAHALCFSLWAASGGTPASSVKKVPEEYATIQAAIDSADGSMTIQIAAGVYHEQLYILGKSGVTLQGEPGAILTATPDLGETIQPWTDGRA